MKNIVLIVVSILVFACQELEIDKYYKSKSIAKTMRKPMEVPFCLGLLDSGYYKLGFTTEDGKHAITYEVFDASITPEGDIEIKIWTCISAQVTLFMLDYVFNGVIHKNPGRLLLIPKLFHPIDDGLLKRKVLIRYNISLFVLCEIVISSKYAKRLLDKEVQEFKKKYPDTHICTLARNHFDDYFNRN